jgi:serine/threonine protein kinase/WD40 repeat protein
MSDCPTDDDLTGFLNESLPADQANRLSAHVDDCAACQGRLERLTHDAGGAVARYKELSSVMSSANTVLRAGGGALLSAPGDGTLILGANAPGAVPQLIGLPRVPGFDVEAEIGRGGMGVVYRARHRRLNRAVALKMILAGAAADTNTVQRFLFEAEILARVQHPQVVQVFEVDTYLGPTGVPIPYLAIELLEGGSLSQRLKAGPLDPRAAAELVEGVARAVHAVHSQGVVHRDLKPGNILFPEDRRQRTEDSQKAVASVPLASGLCPLSSSAPKVTDFGLAKFMEAGPELTGSGQVVGTPHYMAPEQAAGTKQIGPATDVYSLGAILFECLTGRTPFVGSEPMSVLLKVVNDPPPDVRSLRPDVPRDLAAVVMRCLEKDPRRRYASADELADDLRRFLENRPTKARPVTNRERLWLWAKRNPVDACLLAALAASLLIGFVAVTYLWQRAEDTAAKATLSEQSELRAHAATTKALERARESEGAALAAQKNATRTLADREFSQAVHWCEEGRVEEGLRLFVSAVEHAEATGEAELARVARMNIAAWPRELPPRRRAFVHTSQPRLAAFLPDGRHMVTAGRGSEMVLWDTVTGEKIRKYDRARRLTAPVSVLPGIDAPLSDAFLSLTYWTLAVSRDGKLIAVGGTDGQITVWDVDSPKPRTADAIGEDYRDEAQKKPDSPATANVWAIDFAPDGTLWASNGRTGIKKWDVKTRPQPVLRGEGIPALFVSEDERPPGTVNALVVSADGKRVYTGDRKGWVREWDTATLKDVRAWKLPAWVGDLALSPALHGKWEPVTSQELAVGGTLLAGLEPTWKRLAATGPDGVVRVLDLIPPGGQFTLELGPTGFGLAGAYGHGIAFAQNQPLLLASDGDGNVRVWHRDTGQPIGTPMRFSGEVLKMRFRPGSDEFAVPAGNAIYLFSLPDPTFRVLSPGRVTPVGRIFRTLGLDYSPAGDLLAVAKEGEFEAFDPRTGECVQSVSGSGHSPYAIRFDPTGSFVFRGMRTTGLDKLAVPHGNVAEPLPSGNLNRTHRIAFLRGGGLVAMDHLAVWRFDAKMNFVALWPKELTRGVELRALAVHPTEPEMAVSFASRVAFLHPDTLQPVREGWTTDGVIFDLKYTPDGKRLFLGRSDNMAEVRNASDGAPVGRAMPHGKAVVACAVSPDGKLLLTGSRDATARFWDAATGLPVGPPLRHSGPVTHVAFAPDGRHVATGTGTGDLTQWGIPPPAATGTAAELRAAVTKKE